MSGLGHPCLVLWFFVVNYFFSLLHVEQRVGVAPHELLLFFGFHSNVLSLDLVDERKFGYFMCNIIYFYLELLLLSEEILLQGTPRQLLHSID